MSNTGWSPKPLKGLNLGGIFSHEGDEGVKVEKSNRWQDQRVADGTPHTRHGASTLTPPSNDPRLYLEGLDKAIAADSSPRSSAEKMEPEQALKSYFDFYTSLAKGDYQGAEDAVKGAMGAMADGAKAAGKEAGEGFKAGTAAAGKLVGAATKIAQPARNAAKALDCADEDAEDLEKTK